MIVIENPTYEPIKTQIKDTDDKPVDIIVPGNGWRKIEDSERTEKLNMDISDGRLLILFTR